MRIDRLTLSDLPAAVRLSSQAKWNQLEADWRRLLDLWPDGCFVGREDDGSLVATATLANYETQIAWIGMVLVEASRRGRGIGGQMLDAAIGHARSAGVGTLGLDATDLGRPVYLKHGFVDVAKIDRWMRMPGGNAESAASAFAELRCDIDDVLQMDLAATGSDRAPLLRHLIAEPGAVCIAVKEHGYAIVRPGRLADHIGPVVATDEGIAVRLLDDLIERRASAGPPVLIDVPRGRLSTLLPSRGFTLSRQLIRMQSGAGDPRLMGPTVFAAAGFELG